MFEVEKAMGKLLKAKLKLLLAQFHLEDSLQQYKNQNQAISKSGQYESECKCDQPLITHYHQWDDEHYYLHTHRRCAIPHGHHGSRYAFAVTNDTPKIDTKAMVEALGNKIR